jgi:RHS repeat-associated protein
LPATTKPNCEAKKAAAHDPRDNAELTHRVEDRLVTVTQGATTTVFNYDGDGKRVQGSVAGITFTAVGGYYERTGATTIRKYYTFNGRVVAMRQNGTLSWLLADQLGSTSMAVSLTGTVQSQQRYWPWGTARNAGGTLPTDYRYTWQQEVSVIGLYDYDARWYDSDLKRFVQADTLVPEPGNPQALNRYSYVLNSPVVHSDPTGHDVIAEAGYWPNARDPEWVERYRQAHGGAEPNQQDWRDYAFSLGHPGTGPGGSWTESDWEAYGKVQNLLGELLAQRGNGGLPGPRVYSLFAELLLLGDRTPESGDYGLPLDVKVQLSGEFPAGVVPPGQAAWTLGNTIIARPESMEEPGLLEHEYTHVLQYRAVGLIFGPAYLFGGWRDAYEEPAREIRRIYGHNPWLPKPWQMPWAGGH